MLTIRLARFGKKNQPFYRIVLTEKRTKRNGRYLKELGYYNPLTEPAEIVIYKKEFDQWIEKGAQISEGLKKLLKNRKI
jgi:small subunit ribosomal protein S16